MQPPLEQYLIRSFVPFGSSLPRRQVGRSDAYIQTRLAALKARVEREKTTIATEEETSIIDRNYLQTFFNDNDKETYVSHSDGLLVMSKPSGKVAPYPMKGELRGVFQSTRGFHFLPTPKVLQEKYCICISRDEGARLIDLKRSRVVARSAELRPRQDISGMGGDSTQYPVHFFVNKRTGIADSFVMGDKNFNAVRVSLEVVAAPMRARLAGKTEGVEVGSAVEELKFETMESGVEDLCSLQGQLYVVKKEGVVRNCTKRQEREMKAELQDEAFNLITGVSSQLVVCTYTKTTATSRVLLLDAATLKQVDSYTTKKTHTGIRVVEIFTLKDRMRSIFLVHREVVFTMLVLGRSRLFPLVECQTSSTDYQYNAVKMECSEDMVKVAVLFVGKVAKLMCIKY